MKRFYALLMIMCMLLSTAALAEERAPLRQSGVMIDTTFWRDNGIKLADTYHSWDDSITIMQSDDPPDLFGLYTNNEDFAALKATGLLADLSGSEMIRELTDRLRPELKALVTTEDGKILGLPVDNFSWPLYWRQDAFDAAGLTAEDVPQSFTELLDFLDNWVERVKATPEKNVCIADTFYWSTSPAKYTYVYWLLNLLVESWEMQSYYAGVPLNFDTPEFIALAKRTREVGIQLYKVEPHAKKRRKMLQLFENCCAGQFNDGRDYGFSHTIPFRITRDQPMLMRSSALLFVIRSGSEWTDESIAALEDYLSKNDRTSCFYADLYADTVPGEYRYDDDSTATVTAGYLADLASYEGTNAYVPTRTFSMYEGVLLKFRQGEVSVEKFAAEISKPKRNPNK